MSFTRREGYLLLFLALACSQPDANGVDTAAMRSRETLVEGEGPSTTFDSRWPPLTGPMRSLALIEVAAAGQAPGAGQRLPSFVAPYPRGAWRLAIPAALDNVTLWVDQILIRHDAAKNEVSFNLAYWFSVPPPPGRTREQALLLAEQVANEAAANPSAFAELVRRYSEDLPRRGEEGDLGWFSASQAASWPQLLDAVAAIRPGQTSKVIETSYGFHILRRREPPPEQISSGSHIVIGHDRAEWLKVQARGPLPSRSRDDALVLATELYRRARAEPERFQELVDRYSEHRDAVLGGDFGSWSTREAHPFPLRMRRLQQLAVGEVGAPVETHLGFEVILRTEPPARHQYAARAAPLSFNPAAADAAEDSRPRVFAQAEALARTYAAQPQRFGELPSVMLQWQSGRGVPEVELQLEKLGIGAVAPSPVQAEFSFQVLQRVAPEPIAPVRRETELPAPAYPDVRFHLTQRSPESVRALLRDSARLAESSLGLSRHERAHLQALHEGAPLAEATDYFAAYAAVEHVLEGIRKLLGPERYASYLAALQHELASALLGAPADSPDERGL